MTLRRTLQKISSKKLKTRKKILPQRFIDVFCFLIVFIFLPLVLAWDILVILPLVHVPFGLLHSVIFAIALFIFFNILGNMFMVMIIDCAVDFNTLRAPPGALELGWRECESCNKIAPPRSWHCKICKTCVLKRDHHCLFTGCCIGYYNHRYFMMFLIYMFIGSVVSIIYNSYYLFVLSRIEFLHNITFIKMACPVLCLMHGTLWHNVHLIAYNLNIMALVISGVLTISHFPRLLFGDVCHKCDGDHFNLGWRGNCSVIFGRKMHLVWLSPFITSELLNDGIAWKRRTLLHTRNGIDREVKNSQKDVSKDKLVKRKPVSLSN